MPTFGRSAANDKENPANPESHVESVVYALDPSNGRVIGQIETQNVPRAGMACVHGERFIAF